MIDRLIAWYLKRCAKGIIRDADALDEYVRSYRLLNEQWFLDYQDKLNAISVL